MSVGPWLTCLRLRSSFIKDTVGVSDQQVHNAFDDRARLCRSTSYPIITDNDEDRSGGSLAAAKGMLVSLVSVKRCSFKDTDNYHARLRHGQPAKCQAPHEPLSSYNLVKLLKEHLATPS